MIKKLLLAILVASTASALVFNFQLPEKEEKWRNTTLHDGEARFVQLEMVDGEPVVAFKSEEGLVMYEREGADLPLLESYPEYRGENEWERKVLDGNGTAGSYLSMKKIDGSLALAYQDSFIGDEKLYYLNRTGSGWNRELVDSIAGTGLSTGMYTSLTHLEGRPVIFYHTGEGDRFVRAEKQGGEWTRDVIAEDTGWFVSTDSCGDSIGMLYRNRDDQELNRGEYSSTWSREDFRGRTDASTAVDMTGCEFRAAFNDLDSRNVVYADAEGRETVGDGKLSRVSMDYSQGPRIAYYLKGEGLVYAERENGDWNTSVIDSRLYAGQYNDIAFKENPGVAYTQSDKVVYAQYGYQGYGDIKMFADLISGVLMLLTAIAVFIVYRV